MMFDVVLNEFLEELKSSSIDEISEESSCKLLWKFVESDGLQDDLLFFVAKTTGEIQVCRHISNQRPSLDIHVAWTESLALNLICHMNFSLRISSCAYKEGAMLAGICHLVIEEATNKKVFASPLKEHLNKFYGSADSVGSQKHSKYSFPEIYFTVQDYETCFENIKLGPEGILIVELYNSDVGETNLKQDLKGSFYEKIDSSIVLFQGAITSKVLSGAYQRNTKEFGTTNGSFITMTGPDGIGEAQLHAIDSNSLEDLEQFITKKLGRMKQFLFGKSKKDQIDIATGGQYYNCRLRFIRLHWKKIIELLVNKHGS